MAYRCVLCRVVGTVEELALLDCFLREESLHDDGLTTLVLRTTYVPSFLLVSASMLRYAMLVGCAALRIKGFWQAFSAHRRSRRRPLFFGTFRRNTKQDTHT